MTDEKTIKLSECVDYTLDCINEKRWIKHNDEKISYLMDNSFRFSVMTNKKDDLIKIVKMKKL